MKQNETHNLDAVLNFKLGHEDMTKEDISYINLGHNNFRETSNFLDYFTQWHLNVSMYDGNSVSEQCKIELNELNLAFGDKLKVTTKSGIDTTYYVVVLPNLSEGEEAVLYDMCSISTVVNRFYLIDAFYADLVRINKGKGFRICGDEAFETDTDFDMDLMDFMDRLHIKELDYLNSEDVAKIIKLK